MRLADVRQARTTVRGPPASAIAASRELHGCPTSWKWNWALHSRSSWPSTFRALSCFPASTFLNFGIVLLLQVHKPLPVFVRWRMNKKPLSGFNKRKLATPQVTRASVDRSAVGSLQARHEVCIVQQRIHYAQCCFDDHVYKTA